MRASVERFAWRMWRREAGWMGALARFGLLPLEGVWRLATRARNRRYDRAGGVHVEGLDVVSVGNLAVGGTGKTPVSAWVVDTLGALGADVTLLLRGYGEDEVRLHRHWSPDVPVMIDSDRVAAARRARAAGAGIAILDDGFQHRRLARSLDIVLLAAGDPVPGAVLPRGPYREPWSALHRADMVVVTRRAEPADTAHRVVERLRADGALPEGVATAGVHLVATEVAPLAAYRPAGRRARAGGSGAVKEAAPGGALVATAIARPEAFVRDVEALTGGSCELLAFPDHHDFTAGDARGIRDRAAGRPVYVTEKDAMKLAGRSELPSDVRVVRQRLAWDWGEAEVRSRLEALVHRTGERTS